MSYDAIKIKSKAFELPDNFNSIQNLIITSKNAWEAIKNRDTTIANSIKKKRFFCVGAKLKRIIEDTGSNVVEVADNASALAEKIYNQYKAESFLFLCGNLRRDELPDLLTKHQVSYIEKIVYHTTFNYQKFNRTFDGILFASPSAVQSFCKVNNIGDSTAFCIGTTTAGEAKKHTKNYMIANHPSIESMIVQAIKTFRKS
ncbi:uroporphyrinogen-III synthase [Aquimarina sp. ERC-38]|uniref:uroporphyrinogen-III synthase n=1 Tax=Aquimarina sp. ERC-38 TaxID=2949996 RepID=UPI0022484A85|nr:uroporphyrinogen-III synthase [Aquimarina sp. ERC-38]UZO81991.1 uroporphyrinogen-III synthase [Aquimarina sp. ERC-38]